MKTKDEDEDEEWGLVDDEGSSENSCYTSPPRDQLTYQLTLRTPPKQHANRRSY